MTWLCLSPVGSLNLAITELRHSTVNNVQPDNCSMYDLPWIKLFLNIWLRIGAEKEYIILTLNFLSLHLSNKHLHKPNFTSLNSLSNLKDNLNVILAICVYLGFGWSWHWLAISQWLQQRINKRNCCWILPGRFACILRFSLRNISTNTSAGPETEHFRFVYIHIYIPCHIDRNGPIKHLNDIKLLGYISCVWSSLHSHTTDV